MMRWWVDTTITTSCTVGFDSPKLKPRKGGEEFAGVV